VQADSTCVKPVQPRQASPEISTATPFATIIFRCCQASWIVGYP